MELLSLYALILFSFIALISIAYLFYTNNPYAHPNLPPGKMGLPIIGESLKLLSAGKEGCPQKFIFHRITKYSSQVFKTSILGEPMMVVCGAVGNKFLFSNENKFVTAWYPQVWARLFQSSADISMNEEARKMRKLFPNFLKPEALQQYIGVMDQIAEKHFEAEWEGKKQVIALPLSKRYTFLVACKVFLSMEDPKKISSLAKKLDFVTAAIYSIPINFPGTAFNRGLKASNAIRKELIGIIKQRKIDLKEKKASPTQDVLSQMLLTVDDQDGEYMTELEIAQKILGLLVGGSDTTSSAISFILKYLAELPHIYNEVLKEQMEIVKSKKQGELLNWSDIQKMRYSWYVACETMRISPPAQGSFRQAIKDFDLDGFIIPKGWKIFWNAYSTHWNPNCFPNPEKFDPKRFEGNGPTPHTFVPFGGGPRMCPGNEYARLLMLVFMHNVVKRFRWKKVFPEEKTIVVQVPMPSKGLPIHLFPQDTYGQVKFDN